MITLVEDFVARDYQDYIEALVTNAEVPLYFNVSTVVDSTNLKLDSDTIESPQFTHAFLRNGEVTSNHWSVFSPIVFSLMAKNGVGANLKLVRSKLNLNPRMYYEGDKHFTPHIDSSEDGITAVYFLNDSDGDTLFFSDTGDVIKRITPKKGNLVYFDSKIYHAGQPPRSHDYRSVVNFNWVQK